MPVDLAGRFLVYLAGIGLFGNHVDRRQLVSWLEVTFRFYLCDFDCVANLVFGYKYFACGDLYGGTFLLSISSWGNHSVENERKFNSEIMKIISRGNYET